VLRAPFRIRPTPPWFEGKGNALPMGKLLVELERKRSWLTVSRIAALSLAG